MWKTALLLSWWWMKSSFTAWVLLWLSSNKNSKRLSPDICVAGSGSAWTAAYYLSQQYDSIYNIRSNLLTTKETISFRRIHKIIDIDFIIDSVFKYQDPLQVQSVIDAKTHFYIPAFNTKSGIIEYLYQNWEYSLLESLRATKAMPVAYKRFPQIKVWSNYYCDSIFSSQWVNHIQYAIQQWATNILLIKNNPQSTVSWVDEKLFNLWLYSLPKVVRKNYFNHGYYNTFDKDNKKVNITIIQPESKLPIWSLTNNKRDVETCIELWVTISQKIH